jgi:hypothetical protein
MQVQTTVPTLISLNKWLQQLGVTSTTGWRWRKKGILRTINIYGRLYLSQEAIAEFLARAGNGEFAVESKPGRSPGKLENCPQRRAVEKCKVKCEGRNAAQ